MPLAVIGGQHRGRRLRSPRPPVRPTSALLRRSLFDILGSRVVGAAVLDLYAGAGGVGIEALSRGAAACEFVERDREGARIIAGNLDAIAAGDRGRVHCAAVESWLEREQGRLSTFDLIFADPPYGHPGLARTLELLAAPGGVGGDALVVIEERSGQHVEIPAGLAMTRRVRHGDSALTILERASG
jgi:16S rRNA (guanine966-N2)-methyltransferase